MILLEIGSSGGVVVKLLACGAIGPGFNSLSPRYNFRDWLSPTSKSQYGWNIAKVRLILKTNQPTWKCYISIPKSLL